MTKLSVSALLAGAFLVTFSSMSDAYSREILQEQNYPALEKLLNELQHNENNLKSLEVDQSQLQAKISRSKVEMARRHNIVQSLEERQRLEIGRLHNQISALQRHIAALEETNEEMRQKLQQLTEQAIYGDGNIVYQVEHLRDQNEALRQRNRQLQLIVRELLQRRAVYETPAVNPYLYPNGIYEDVRYA
ncbi:hypothetical protein Ddc_14844 [Ditylenchus destructor]|nr:hypothetical protein Ddc_14844 [Ditylenchus destructor]